MNYQALQEAIATAIKTNGEGEITGAVLQSVLQSMVSIVGANYQFMGVATTNTNPGTPAGSVFYLTSTAGTYTNFNNIVVEDGKLVALMWDSTAWSEAEIADLGGAESAIFDKAEFTSSDASYTTFGIILMSDGYGQNSQTNGVYGYDISALPTGQEITIECYPTGNNPTQRAKLIGWVTTTGAIPNTVGNRLEQSEIVGQTQVTLTYTKNAQATMLYVNSQPAYVKVSYKVSKIDGIDEELEAIEASIAIEKKATSYMEKLGVLDNLLVDCSLTTVDGTTVIASPFKYNSNGKLWGLLQSRNLKYKDTYAPAVFDTYGILKIKKSGITGRTYVVTNFDTSEGSTFSNQATFTESVEPGYITRNAGHTKVAKVLRVDEEYIWLFLPCYEYDDRQGYGYAKNYPHYVYACDSYTSTSSYTSGELVVDLDHCFTLRGSYKVDDDIESLINIERKYFTRPEKLNSQIQGKSVLLFSDSLSYFEYGLLYDWGLHIYSNSWGGARMGYESGGGAGGESAEYENAWLCRDTYVQYVKTNVIQAGVNIDFIVSTAGVNGTLPDTDATEVAFVINNKRWYHDSLDADPWASLSSDNKLRFTSTACTFGALYSLCRVYTRAIPVIVAPYRTPGANSQSTMANWTGQAFATRLFNGNLSAKRDALEAMSRKLGGLFVDCYTKTRDSIANVPAYHSTDGAHPDKIVAQDMANQVGEALNINHGMIEEDLTD